ncbi:Coenzyme F420 hydrogenase/dehydrogenase, beta subunit C-terminal domain [Methanobrevibacter sp. DSM 116169]|uniref:Coenzyme F420 hydrogenase/dehydrogenase, beta subunit C-terminal domain n=1 Tax=Methanobrevibacter sp. DSM 116169 TaxID=3242727 RepID=UPI0038FCC8E3
MSDNKTAMVGTPCQVLAGEKINRYENETGGSPIDVKIGLFCMENFSYSYLEKFLKENDIALFEVKDFKIENGFFIANLIDGNVFKVPLSQTEPFTRKNCEVCTDYTANSADISVGSVGSSKGYSTVIVRTKKGQEIIEGCIKKRYIEIDKLSDKGHDLLEKISNKKISKNLKNIAKRESISRPVLSKRNLSEEEFYKESENCHFDNLEADVISVGSCVLCGACEYVCPEDIIKIDDRKPVKKGECLEECHACYFACPRTFVSNEIYDDDIDENPLGNYLRIFQAKSNAVIGQDGGVVSSILIYLLENNIVDDVSIVGQDVNKSWKPYSYLTPNVEDVVAASGTKYSTVPIGFKALNEKGD